MANLEEGRVPIMVRAGTVCNPMTTGLALQPALNHAALLPILPVTHKDLPMLVDPFPARCLRRAMAAVALGVFSSSGMAQDSPSRPAGAFSRGEERLDVDGSTFVLPWRFLAPSTPDAGTLHPLVIFLHGAGERGDDNERQLTWFAKDLPGSAFYQKHPAYVLAPQCPKGKRWVEVDWSAQHGSQPAEPSPAMRGVIQAVKHLVREHPIDPDRIILTGLSMGGYGSWDLATRKPTWFAACAPICGGGDDAVAYRLVGLPTWAWHGAIDPVVPVERSRNMIAAIRAAGGDPRYSEVEGVKHDSWKPAYDHAGELLPWLFEQRQGEAAGLETLTGDGVAWKNGDRIAFLGDSITQAGARGNGYVNRIEAAVNQSSQGKAVGFVKAGISGHKVPDLLARVDRDVLSQKPTITFVYIGINDVWHFAMKNRQGTPLDAFEAGLDELVVRLKAGGSDVVLATPSVIGEKRAGENTQDGELDRYAAASRRIATKHGLVLCDLRRDFQDRLELLNHENAARGILTSDGVHLNDAGNAFVAGRVAVALRTALARR